MLWTLHFALGISFSKNTLLLESLHAIVDMFEESEQQRLYEVHMQSTKVCFVKGKVS